jgi:hypothetical protein
MGTRGRRSAAEIAIDQFMMKAVRRPDPPRHLDVTEATEWREIVLSLPADYFAGRPRQILLELWCSHAGEARHISKLIATCCKQNKPDREYEQLLGMRRQQTEMIMRLSRAMGFPKPGTEPTQPSQRPALGPPLLFKPWNRQQ